MNKQCYSPRFLLIFLLLSTCIGSTVKAQLQLQLSGEDITIGNDGSFTYKNHILEYVIYARNTSTTNITSSTLFDNIPAGTSYVPGSTYVNGTSVPDINGKMPFTGTGSLINSPAYGAGILAPNATVQIVFDVKVNAGIGNITSHATMQGTYNSATILQNSNTVTTLANADPQCTTVYQSTAVVTTGAPPTYPYKVIKGLNTTNGTAGTTYFTGATTPCYNALTGAVIGTGTVLTDAEAIGYDENTNRIYFVNGTTNNPAKELCYGDFGTGYLYKFVGYPLETNTAANYNIIAMSFASDGNGYALTANYQDLIRFSVDPSTNVPTITQLGALVNDAGNGTNDVLAETGGDMFADGSGKLFLVTNSYKLYRIDPSSRNTTYLGTISGIPAGAGVNSIASDQAGNLYLSGAYQNVYKVDLSTLTAVTLNSGVVNVWKDGDYSSCSMAVIAPLLNATKSWADVSGNPPATFVPAGDPVEYTITVTNTGNIRAAVAKLYDAIPTYAHYIANTTTMNGVAVADIGGAMPFSVSGGGLINTTGESAGIVKPGDANKVVIKFRITTDPFRTVCNQSVITYPDADNNTNYVLSDDPSLSGDQDSTCFWSDAVTCINCRTALTGTNTTTESIQPIIAAQVQPNPFISQLNLQVQSNTATQVQVRLIDFYGRTVYTTTQNVSAGYSSLHLDVPASLASGIYVLELSAGNNRLLQKKLIKQ